MLKRTSRLKVKGRSRFPHRRDPEFLAGIREMDCLIADKHTCGFWPDRPGIEPAHLKTQGSGGDDVGNVVPLCPRAHDEQEGHTAEFEQKYDKDLALAADELGQLYRFAKGLV